MSKKKILRIIAVSFVILVYCGLNNLVRGMEKEENNNKLNSLTIHSSPLKARYWIENYSRENGGWKSYTNTSWATMLFDNFTGDERLKGALHPKNWTVE